MFQMKKKGSVLSIETVLYLVAILIFVGLGLATYSGIQQQSRVKRAQADLADIAQAVSHYHYDMDKYPDTLDDLEKTSGDDKTSYFGPWIAEVKKSPWNTDYQYEKYSNGTKDIGFVVYIKNDGNKGTKPSTLKEASQNSASHVKDGTLFVVGR